MSNRWMMRALLPLLSLSAGCFPWMFFDDDDSDTIEVALPPPDQQQLNRAPTIDIDIPDWPPPGPESVITLRVADDRGLDTVDVLFRNDLTFFPFGLSDEIQVNADALGEGLGALDISVTDIEGARTNVRLDDLLVDLSPPEITIGETVVRHAEDSEIELWVADAWILGGVEITVGDTTYTHEFEEGYPSTLGESWDYSLVQFPATDFAEGTNDARVVAYDAAGNFTETTFVITLDGQAPLVAITSPEPSAVVSGLFDVVLTATDEGGGPVWVEIRVEGTPVATAVGPTATVQLDAAELTPGAVDLQAVAKDQAGNESVIATVPITVE